jgi:hypothetical protein
VRLAKLNEISGVIRTTLFLCLLLAAPGVAISERLPIKNYTTADGLARDHVGRIVRDSNVFLWFCTSTG